MAQRPTADYPIDANTTSGTDLSLILNRFQTALESGNSGSSRPAYITAGGLWVKEGDPMELYLFDGTTDQLLYDTANGINVTEGLWTLVDENDAAGEIQRPSDVLIDGNLTVTGEFVDGDGNPISIIDPATEQGVIATWDNTSGQWTPESGVTFNSGTTTFETTSGSSTLFLARGDTGVRAYLQSGNAGYVGTQTDNAFSVTAHAKAVLTVRPDLSAEFKGNVGIGASSNVYSDRLRNLVVASPSNTGITIAGGPSSRTSIQFTEEGAADIAHGLIDYYNDQDKMALVTAGQEQIIIGADGKTSCTGNFTANSGSGQSILLDPSTLQFERNGWNYIKTPGGTSAGLAIATGSPNTSRLQIDANGRVDITGSLYVNGTPKIGTVDLIKAFSKLRDAIKDEETVESLKESITNCIGGLIEEWESMQSPATQEITPDNPEVGTMDD